jgi:hypothetical protein
VKSFRDRERHFAWSLLAGTRILTLLLIAGAFGGTALGIPVPALAQTAAEYLRQLNNLAVTLPVDPVAFNQTVRADLADYSVSLERCLAASQSLPAGVNLGAVLSGIGRSPARQDSVTEQKFRELSEAIGTNGGTITSYDLELCSRAIDLDRQLASFEQSDASIPSPNASIRRIDRSLQRCVAAIDSVGPNSGAATILEELIRKPGDRTFTNAGTLGRVQAAAGQSLDLTPRDLESCVAAYDTAQVRVGVHVGDNLPPCNSSQQFCQGTSGSPVCCDSASEVCGDTCGGRGSCFAACQPKWCFPGDALVTDATAHTKPISEVRIGDRLQVVRSDGTLGFEEVYLLTHSDATAFAPYLSVALDSGRTLTLSARHFVPTAARLDAGWDSRLLKGANELRSGDAVWTTDDNGAVALSRIVSIARKPGFGAYSPLTMSGTVVVDGVVASAHSDWFLDGYVSADKQARVYQTMFAPVRGIYRLIGPTWTREITEHWDVVAFVRDLTESPGLLLIEATSFAVIAVVGVGLLHRRRHAVRRA